MISVVCIYNNKKILDDYLFKSLKKQTVNYELILIDNIKEKYKSAAEALNYGGKKSKCKYLMFVHQDVDLSSNTWLEEAEKILDELPKVGIAGVAGRTKNEDLIITQIKHGNPSRFAGKMQIKKPVKVQTVDECLVIIPKAIFASLQFDENVCDDWHLYAVDYCLSIKKLGFDSYVLPIFIHHKSPGYSISGKYFTTLKKVLKKHKNEYDKIYTTVGNWSTKYPVNIKRICLWTKKKINIFLSNKNNKETIF